MALCRVLLLRSIRRYSSNPNPYPFHSPFPTSNSAAADTANHPPPYAQYTPPHHNPQNPNTYPPPNQFHSPISSAAGGSHYQYNNPHYSNPNAAPTETSNYYNNPQYPNAANNIQLPNSGAAGGSNSQYSPENPAAPTQTPNYYNNSQSSAPNTTSPATNNFQLPTSTTAGSTPFTSQRSYGFSSAEEAAAERRRRKRRLRIEPPLYALRPNPQSPPPNSNNPDKPRLPDSTSALVGQRLNLHNRVQSLIRAGDLDSASYVARQSVFGSVRPTVFTCNAIIAAMYRAKRYSDAKALFQYFFRQFNIIPNIVSYNNLIVSHCESGEIEDALKVYEYILENAPYSPSAVSYRHLTKGLIDAERISDAVGLLREMLHKGHGADSLVFNNVILGFLNLGNLEKANELFDELKERCTVYDGVVNATFMDWFFNQGKPKEAMESYRDLMARNYRMVPATRNVLLETLLKHGKKKDAWNLFHDMLDDHTPPTFQAVNADTFNMMINECFKDGNVAEAIDVFKRAGKGEKSKPFQMDVAGFNNMMARLSELEMMEEAEQYYEQLCAKSLCPDVNTYKTLIDAYIKVDRVDNMIEKYRKMVESGLRVIPPYANKWFGYMIGKGKASDCLPILSKMVDKEPKPDVTTYDIVMRGLVEEGNFDATANLVREMVNQGIGFTASLKEFVLDAFERLGRRAEIESTLNRFPSPSSPPRPYQGPRGPPRVENGGLNPGMPWQTASNQQMSYGNQYTQQITRVENGGLNPCMPWQQTASNQQMSYGNQYTQQNDRPRMTEQMVNSHPVSEQETEFPRMVGQNSA